MAVSIVPTAECHLEGLYRAFDSVARERQYLTFFQAPPKDECFTFYRTNVERDLCQYVAVDEDVLGWCDILPVLGQARAHVGSLAIGIVPQARGRGIGARLMTATIEKAWSKGLERIQLAVRADNQRAKALYERLGFVVEGLLRRDFRVDGQYFDGHIMALFRE
jgi:putative acetyltransferase